MNKGRNRGIVWGRAGNGAGQPKVRLDSEHGNSIEDSSRRESLSNDFWRQCRWKCRADDVWQKGKRKDLSAGLHGRSVPQHARFDLFPGFKGF